MTEHLLPSPPLATAGRRLPPRLAWLRQRRRLLAWPLVGLVALGLMGVAWQVRREPLTVTLTVGVRPLRVTTETRTVGALLREQGYSPTAADIVAPPLAAPLRVGRGVTLILARAMTVTADGRRQERLTQAATVGDLLREADVPLGPADRLWLDGREVTAATPLPAAVTEGRPRGALRVERGQRLTVVDGATTTEIATTARTLGAALHEAGITLFESDIVTPALASRVTPDLRVTIQRARPVTIAADGATVRTRTQAPTVGALLAERGLTLRPLDLLTPTLDTPLAADLRVAITRIDHRFITETETIPFETTWVADPTLELDRQRIVQEGREGTFARQTLVMLRDGVEQSRILQRELILTPPQPQTIAYGTNVVLRSLETPSGTVQYWRKLRVLATSYTAASSGKPRNHPEFGITRTGRIAGYGIIAVDPRVIRLNSMVYVPDYGVAVAGDTGGRVIGRHVDLGYDEHNYQSWYRWIDIYVLAPVPAPEAIRWVLPTWPLGRSGAEVRGGR